jgi:hypothetical protein
MSSLKNLNSDSRVSKNVRKVFIALSYETFRAYLWGAVISRMLAICDFDGSKTRIIPDQSEVRSDDLQIGQTFPIVIALHFLQATSFGKFYLTPPFFSFTVEGVAG